MITRSGEVKCWRRCIVLQSAIFPRETVLSKAIQAWDDNGITHNSDKKACVIGEAAIMCFVYPDLGIEEADTEAKSQNNAVPKTDQGSCGPRLWKFKNGVRACESQNIRHAGYLEIQPSSAITSSKLQEHRRLRASSNEVVVRFSSGGPGYLLPGSPQATGSETANYDG